MNVAITAVAYVAFILLVATAPVLVWLTVTKLATSRVQRLMAGYNTADDLMDLADTLDGWKSFVDAHPELAPQPAPEETR